MAELGVSDDLSVTPAAAKARAPWDDTRCAFARNPAALFGFYVTAVLVVLALFGPGFAEARWIANAETRNFLAQMAGGLRMTLALAFLAALVAFVFGAIWGALAGGLGGAIAGILMWIVDALAVLPLPLFVIAGVALLTPPDPTARLELLAGAIGASAWLGVARAVYARIIALRRAVFVDAARAAGASPAQIFFRHVALNLLGALAAPASLIFPTAVTVESTLSFLGFGPQVASVSLGALIAHGAAHMDADPWRLAAPCLLLAALLAALQLMGDGLRSAIAEIAPERAP